MDTVQTIRAVGDIGQKVIKAQCQAARARIYTKATSGAYAPQANDAATLAEEEVKNALESVMTLLTLLRGQTTTASQVPLHLLDTPSVRRLLVALEEAAAAGAAVDEERGWLGARGEPRGYGATYKNAADVLRTETFGPQGRE